MFMTWVICLGASSTRILPDNGTAYVFDTGSSSEAL